MADPQKYRHLTIGVTLVALAAQSIAAQTRSWNNPNGGVFGTNGNWTPSGSPTVDDDARFDLGTTYTVVFEQDRDVEDALVRDGNVTLAAGGNFPGDVKTFGVRYLDIVETGSLKLDPGSRDLHMNVSENLATRGNLTIQDGASADVGELQLAAATALVTGVGPLGEPSRLTVSDLRAGTSSADSSMLRIENGAHLNTLSTSYVSDAGNAEVVVSGVDAFGNPSTWNTANLATNTFVGSALMHFLQGARINSAQVKLGIGGLTDVFLSGADTNNNPATWTVAEELEIGLVGDATININRAGYLSTSTVSTGTFGGSGTIKLLGNGPEFPARWHNSGDVFVGGDETSGQGTGQVLIEGHAVATVDGTLTIWQDGLVSIAYSLLEIDRIDHLHGGAFEMLNGGVLQTDRFDGDLSNQAGTLAAGRSGQTNIVGDYIQGDQATLLLDIGGPVGVHDVIAVSDTAELDGSLALSLSNGFTPGVSDTLTLFGATNILGFFDNALPGQRLDTVDGLGSFVVNYGVLSPFGASQIVLSDFLRSTIGADFNGDGAADCVDVNALVADIAAGTHTALYDLTGDSAVNQADLTEWLAQAGAMNLPTGNSYLVGDANLDGAVDGLDFILWNDNKFTSSPAWCGGDFDADGSVDGQDFILWNDTKFTSADRGVSTVPEPSGMWMVIMLAGVLHRFLETFRQPC